MRKTYPLMKELGHIWSKSEFFHKNKEPSAAAPVAEPSSYSIIASSLTIHSLDQKFLGKLLQTDGQSSFFQKCLFFRKML
jgi:hypothetical protein